NGEYPVEADVALFMANSMAGSFAAQSFCASETHCLIICPNVRLARSVLPSVCG
ncbi:hypothetical protein AURDEDRAFT_69308, partial [Auricularia subglabra TFB-10046 SS5]